MTNILSFEITHVPGSLADKNDGPIRTGNKAELLSVFKADQNLKEWPTKLPFSEYLTGLVYDTMVFVHSNRKERNETYAELSHRYLFRVLKEAKTIPKCYRYPLGQ